MSDVVWEEDRQMKRWWIPIAVILVAVIAFFVYRGFSQSQAGLATADLQTEIVRMGPLTATVGATGVVRANQSAILSFKTSGTAEDINVKQGDEVRRDQVLATLERKSLSSQIILAEADLAAAERALEDLLQSQQSLASARLALAQAQDALDDVVYTLTVRQKGNRASSNTLQAAEANLVLGE